MTRDRSDESSSDTKVYCARCGTGETRPAFSTLFRWLNSEYKVIALLLVGLIAVHAGTVVLLELTDQHWPELGALIAFALVFTGIGLGSVYCVWGRTNLAVRFLALVVATALGSVVATCGTRASWTLNDLRTWSSMLAIYTLYVMLPLSVARLAGLTLVSEHDLSGRTRQKLQFSTGSALSLITVIAIILVLFRELDVSNKYVFWRGSNLAFSFAWMSGICTLSVLLPPNRMSGSIRNLVACFVLGFIVSFIPLGIYNRGLYIFMAAPEFREDDYSIGANSFQVFATIAFHAGSVIGALTLVRAAGFRLTWRPTPAATKAQ